MTDDINAVKTRRVTRLRDGGVQELDDVLVVEEPLEVRVGDERWTITMRTPGQDFDLVRGLLFTEGMIQSFADIGRMHYCDTGEQGAEENIVAVHLAQTPTQTRRWQRNLMAGTSCGLCGQAAIDAIGQDVQPLAGGGTISRETLLGLPHAMRRRQALFQQTGGLHAVGLFTHTGECLCVFEDIGRHNATDKAIGWGLAQGLLPWASDGDPLALLVSGRASFEITQKALLARIPIVCSVSAASTLAAELAEANNQTLVGFLRDTGLTVYAGGHRVTEG